LRPGAPRASGAGAAGRDSHARSGRSSRSRPPTLRGLAVLRILSLRPAGCARRREPARVRLLLGPRSRAGQPARLTVRSAGLAGPTVLPTRLARVPGLTGVPAGSLARVLPRSTGLRSSGCGQRGPLRAASLLRGCEALLGRLAVRRLALSLRLALEALLRVSLRTRLALDVRVALTRLPLGSRVALHRRQAGSRLLPGGCCLPVLASQQEDEDHRTAHQHE